MTNTHIELSSVLFTLSFKKKLILWLLFCMNIQVPGQYLKNNLINQEAC